MLMVAIVIEILVVTTVMELRMTLRLCPIFV